MAAGFNSVGIVSAGGAGMALAQWINDGEPPLDLWDVDIRRVQPFQRNRAYLTERVSETLGLLYADHWPYRQIVTARGVRRSPLHDHLAERGAVFGEAAGLGAGQLVRPMRDRRASTATAGSARTGSTTSRPSTWPSAKGSACST